MTEQRSEEKRRRSDLKFVDAKEIGIVTLAALLVGLGAIFAFFDQIHNPYVTHEELEIRLLRDENKRLRESAVRASIARVKGVSKAVASP